MQEGYQSYEQYYSDKNLAEEKRSLFPLESTGIWTELSPRVPRVTYLGVYFTESNTGWIAGNLGALIKTTDGGESWTISQTNTNTLLLKVHSFNGQTVIATGYDGMILRSTDGGETFTQIMSGVTSDLWGVQMLNDTVGFVCGLNQTLLKTTDAGQSWQPVNAGLNEHYWAIDFLDESYGIIACGGGKVLRTNDGGNSWIQVQAGDASDLYSIDIIDPLHIAAAGYLGKTVYSSDGGLSWVQNAAVQHNELNSIRFINADTGYTVGTYGGESWGIRKTTNKGLSWFTPASPNLSEWELALLPDDVGYSVGSNLMINKTTEGYDNWKGMFFNANLVDVFFTDELTGYVADGRWTGGPLYKTTDGGLSWFALPNFPSNAFVGSLMCVTFTDSLTGFGGGMPARIVKTTDAGESWYVVNRTGLTDTIGLINRFFFIDQTTGWAVTTRGGILKTTDSGENWFAQLNAGISVVFSSVYFVDSLNGWTANSSARPYKTTDGGNNWIQQTNLNFFDSNDIFFNNFNNGLIISSNSYLYKTSNSGSTWILILNSGNIIRNFGWLFAQHGLIMGNTIYETIDSGNTWQEILELRNIGLRRLHSPKNNIGFLVGYTGLVYRYIDTTIVPVELISFDSVVEDNLVTLRWFTSSETNNYGFEILRSEDKINWKKIAFVEGKGTTTETQSYTVNDEISESNSYYYQLKQIDYNGTIQFSKIIEVKVVIKLNFALHQNYPNPFNPLTKIEWQTPFAGFNVLKIYDVLGSEVKTLVDEFLEAGKHSIDFNASGLSSGIYFYKLKLGGNTYVRKMILLQ
ncbi:MAG: Ycf48-like protein [Ignavibacteria bacterium ADurb.Bin266]|nr:MAG: Ycf48-like protein [Ignavibacteria bacterium ADurb.Bin266]